MDYLAFIRKPLKYILSMIFVLSVSSGMTIFAIQSYLDGKVAEYCLENTAYIGSVSSRFQDVPLLKSIPDDIVQSINESKTVANTMKIRVYSAKADGLQKVVDNFGSIDSLEKKLFIEGTVAMDPQLYSENLGVIESFKLNIKSVYAGHYNRKDINVTILREPDLTAPKLKSGDHVFLIGRYDGSIFYGDSNGMLLYDPAAHAPNGIDTKSPIWNFPIYVLPDDCSEQESDTLIKEFLSEKGIADSVEIINQLDNVFTINAVDDMSMVLSVVNEYCFISEGRELNRSDIGSRVCVISDTLASENNVRVGDAVGLAIASTCYMPNPEGATFDTFGGWEIGYPYEDDTFLDYPDYESFEVVGIYSEVRLRQYEDQLFIFHSRNDIFIPGGVVSGIGSGADTIARDLTFSVPGSDFDNFMDDFEDALYDRGYIITMVDAGWEQVSEQYYKMNSRRVIMEVCAIVVFLAFLFLSILLITRLYNREYALRRSFGETHREAKRLFYIGAAVIAVPPLLLSIPLCFAMYSGSIKEQTYQIMQNAIPGDGTIIANIALYVLIELIVFFAIVAIISFRQRNKNLIGQIK